MAIEWNREITGKDIKKFFNQEVKLGEVDYAKCFQVVVLVFALGVAPAFTYGMVLGLLEEERLALMSEVDTLKAQVITATQASQIIYNANVDKSIYTVGATTTVFFGSATSTGSVRIDLLTGKGQFVYTIATTTVRLGSNRYSFVVPGSVASTTDLFSVQVSLLNPKRTISTNKFEVRRPAPISTVKRFIVNATPGNYITKTNLDIKDDVKLQYMYNNKNLLYFVIGDWRVGFAATKRSERLTVGKYINATRFPLNDGVSPGLDFTGPGRGNNVVKGEFTVHEIIYDSTGELVSFAADFVLYEEGILTRKNEGQVRYNSSYPIKPGNTLAPKVSLVKTDQIYLPNISDISSDDQGKFSVEFSVTAVVDTYIRTDAKNILWSFEASGGGVGAVPTLTALNNTSAQDTTTAYFVKAGSTRNFKFDTSINPSATSLIRVSLTGITWGTTPTEANVLKFASPFTTSALWVLN